MAGSSVRAWIRAFIALCVVAIPLVGIDGGGSASAQPRHLGTAHHGPAVRPGSFDGDLRKLRPADPLARFRLHPEPQLPGVPAHDKQPVAGAPTAQTAPALPARAAPAPSSTSFDGLDFDTWGDGHPPDTVGDVGPNHYVQAVNTAFAVYAKSGGAPLAATTFNDLWASAPAATSGLCRTDNFGDPTVVYDPMADRWIVADFAFAGDGTVAPFYECIAVSKTANPVTGGWWLYAVRTDDAAHPWLADYPKMGIWPDGLYMSANMFGPTSYEEVRLWAFNRSDLESGASLRQVVMDLGSASQFGLLPANVRGTSPPNGSSELFVAESQTLFAYEVYKFHVDYAGSGSTLTSAVTVSQTTFTDSAAAVKTPGNSLDTLADRLMMQAQYRNLGGVESLWVTHTVRTSQSGPFATQWAQLNVTGGSVSTTPVQQQIYGNVNSDGISRWMGSLAVDDKGDMALGYSAASATLDPAIRYAGRLVGDPLGTLPQTETSMIEGGGSQTGNCGPSACTRWGDYSAMSVDPVDGCTFWYTSEYYATDGLDWHTRIGSFAFPSCLSSAPAATTMQTGAVEQPYGGTATLTATLTQTSGGAPVSGRTVTFLLNGVSKGSDVTDSSGVASVPGVSLGTISAGTYPTGVHATFAGDATYASASGDAQLVVDKAAQTVTFNGAPSSAVYGSSFPVTATSTSGLPVTIGASGACSNSGTTVQMTSGTGTCVLTADQPGNTNYAAAPQKSQSTTASKAAQSVQLTVPATKLRTDAPFAVSGAATSGLAVTLGIQSGPCSLSGTTVTLTGAGDCVVIGDQGGNTNYSAAPTATAHITVTKAGQLITFSPLTDATYGDPDINLGATASSGLPVAYSLLPGDPCTLAATTLHIEHAGTCHVTASQSGDDSFNTATPVERDLLIAPAATGTALVLSVPAVQYSDPVTLTATITPSDRTGTVDFAVAGQPLGSAPVAGGTAALTAAVTHAVGSVPVTATFRSADSDHAGSADGKSLTVGREAAGVRLGAKALTFTASTGTAGAQVRLTATVTDVADGHAGDVRRARVTFVNRRTGAAISGCTLRAVTLPDTAVHTVGTATCKPTLSAASTDGGTGYLLGAVVGGDYGRNASADDAVITVARPRTARFAAVDATLKLVKPAGSLAGAKGSFVQVGGTATYNTARTTLHGTMAVLFTHARHVYLARLAVPATITGSHPTATVAGTAVLTDITDVAHPVVLSGKTRLTVTMTDPGSTPDKLGVTLRNRAGTLLLSTQWTGSSTSRQGLAAGSVVVR